MNSEIKNKDFRLFLLQATITFLIIVALITSVNYFIDASQMIKSKTHVQMARLALDGNIVAVPENYNERVYQMAIVDEMNEIPETLVIGSSRGMYLGEEVTGYKRLYNSCVSGACIEDYYALIGLYYQKFSDVPSRVVIETSPWIFYEDNPEAMWSENYTYLTSCKNFYQEVNGHDLVRNINKENPYFSIPYFQYNFSMLKKVGIEVFHDKEAKISIDCSEAADYPDGSIRYRAEDENASIERLEKVRATEGAVIYEAVNNMIEISDERMKEYEKLLQYLLKSNSEVIIYLQPFSFTQCHYIYDENMNPIFGDIEDYLNDTSLEYGVQLIGSYNARNFDITDELFIDFMHLDKTGTKIVWNYGSKS